jgi:hypothetical protein
LVIVNISGGLGNQMFQFAFGQVISLQLGLQVKYSIDSLSAHASARNLGLENAFNLALPLASLSDISNLLGSLRSSPRIRRILGISNLSFLGGRYFLTEKKFLKKNDLASVRQNGAYFHGYWQSENFFKNHEALIRSSFQFRGVVSKANQRVIELITASPSIAVHVRRGDYVSNPKANAVHGVLGARYYISAIASLRKRAPNSKVYIFSDDPIWVGEELLSEVKNCESININQGVDSFRDMQLMAMCDHNIISNSSFSWWSAWLNTNPKKIIISPKQWFSKPALSSKSIVPLSWDRI